MPDELRRFILTSIQSVPFVEAALLFMGQAGLALDAPTVARRLYVSETTANELAAALLWREYSRTRFRILFWSALCFGFLTLNNVLLVLDRFVYTDVDLTLVRLMAASAAMLLLLFGLIWESE